MATQVIDKITTQSFTDDSEYTLSPGELLIASVNPLKVLTVWVPDATENQGAPCAVKRTGSSGDVYLRVPTDSEDVIDDQDTVTLGTNATGGYEMITIRSSGAPEPGWIIESSFKAGDI